MRGALIGRDEERRAVEASLRDPGSVVVAGQSGIGKTALARAVVTAISASTVIWTSATRSSQSLPFGAFAPLFTASGIGPELMASGDAFALARATQALRAHPGTLLVVDDAQFLDDASATLVHQLTTTAAARTLLTITTGQPTPDAITVLWKDAWAPRVELLPLSRIETEALVDAIVEGPCSPVVHHEIWEATRGNPLFVSELLHAARASGAVRAVDGRWELVARLTVGRRLNELVGARIDELDDGARRVAEVVAISEPVRIALLDRLVDLEGLAAAEAAGVVHVEDGDEPVARVVHPTYAEVLRSRAPSARRRATARALADASEAAGMRGPADTLRFATWRLDAGRPPAVSVLVDAAWHAAEAQDFALAERFARAALDEAPRDDEHAARIALADAQYRQGDHNGALETLDTDPGADDRAIAESAVLRAKVLLTAGRGDAARESVDTALARVGDAGHQAWLRGFRATVLVADAQFAEGIALAERVVRDAASGPRARLTGLSALAMGYAFAGRSTRALEAIERGRDAEPPREHDLRTPMSWATPASFAAHWTTGDLAAADAVASAFRELGMQARNPEWVAGASAALAWIALARGDVTGARVLLADATIKDSPGGWSRAATLGLGGIEILAAAAETCAAALAGDVDRARAAQREIAPEVLAVHRGPRWFDGWAAIARAWAAVADGRLRGARDILQDLAADARDRGDAPIELEALFLLARLGDARTVASRLAKVARTVDGPYAPIVAAYCAALAARDGDALDAAAAAFSDAGFRLVAAETFLHAAATHAAAGVVARAEASRSLAAREVAACPGAASPLLDGLRTRPLLTTRELEIAHLAARGRATREIATELVLSTRTVESHLAHIYTKLGVAGRHELPAALSAPDPPPDSPS